MRSPALMALGLTFLTNPFLHAAELKIILPQNRTAFQTNEWIDVSVVRSSKDAIPASLPGLILGLHSSDNGSITAVFPAPAVPVFGADARATEHFHINGALLRPGKYTITAMELGGKASAEIEVFSHLRQSSFRLINWGRATGKQQLVQGENSLGFNLFYGHYGSDEEANFLRAGVDFMSNCTMGGGHQMDLRNECDWSDPYVLKGGTRRVVRRAMIDRNRPNVPGVHFYDEPGLTWDKHPATGEYGPHMIPAQVRSYVAAFGMEPLSSEKVDPKNPEHVARWNQWARWKLGFMDAAWKEAQFGVQQVRPDYQCTTQSQYGWSAFTDGYYFNVVRSLPITSGHGGYHDFGPGFFNPSYFLEMARARDYWKPCWYLPTWYGNTTSDQFRLEQYLSFQTGIQGLMSPPDLEPATNASARQGIVESNQLMKKLGPIFTTMQPTKPPVAMLYSLSQCLHAQTKDMKESNYAHGIPHGKNMPLTYLAGRLIQQPFLTVVEEDVLDGTLANDHKAVILTSIDYLAPDVVKALEDFAKNGGLVILTGDSTVSIQGGLPLSTKPSMPDQAAIDKLVAEKKYGDLGPYTTTAKYLEGALPLGKEIRAILESRGIAPVQESNVPTIITTRHTSGDIEYFFAVNATPDANAKDAKGNPDKITPAPVTATLPLPVDGRSWYDAVRGGPIVEAESALKAPRASSGPPPAAPATFRFGPGEMRVFARSTRPISGVRTTVGTVSRELAVEKEPITIDIAVTLVDDKGRVISGAAPLHIQVIDALGVIRHELYRATKLGQFSMRLPLAANDPAGAWKVVVTELLAGTSDTATFAYKPPVRARALFGATPRAVYHPDDRANIFRFARTFPEVTIVKGTSPYLPLAASRLSKALEPWGIKCKELPLAEAAKSRSLTEAETRTWCGLAYAGKGQIKPGDGNAPSLVGFAVNGPVILLGNPDDNPLIRFLATEKFLPYAVTPDFPGRGRGLIAWQRDGIGPWQESVTLIAHDDAGMNEAVGSFYEAIAGLEPLTHWTLPQRDELSQAKSASGQAAASVAWTAFLPDRVLALQPSDRGMSAITHDGSRTLLGPDGKVLETKTETGPVPPTPAPNPDLVKKHERADRMLKYVVASEGKLAIAYWGGTLRIADAAGAIKCEQQLPQDVTALAWQGNRLIAGLADGRVLALEAK